MKPFSILAAVLLVASACCAQNKPSDPSPPPPPKPMMTQEFAKPALRAFLVIASYDGSDADIERERIALTEADAAATSKTDEQVLQALKDFGQLSLYVVNMPPSLQPASWAKAHDNCIATWKPLLKAGSGEIPADCTVVKAK